MEDYISEKTYQKYLESYNEQKAIAEENSKFKEKEDYEGVSSGISFRDSCLEVNYITLKQTERILANNIINAENLPYLKKSKGIGIVYKVVDEKGNEINFITNGLYQERGGCPEGSEFISYASPLAEKLFPIFSEEGMGDYRENDYSIEVNGRVYKLLSIGEVGINELNV